MAVRKLVEPADLRRPRPIDSVVGLLGWIPILNHAGRDLHRFCM